MKKYIIPVVIPYKEKIKDWVNDNQKITKDYQDGINARKLEEIVESHLNKIPKNTYVEVAFLGTDFTNLEEKMQEELLKALQDYIKFKKIHSIRVSIRPNNITRTKLKILKKYKVKAIELEVYSTNEYILQRINMNYSFKDIKRASRMIRYRGFKLGHKIMIGLPDSTKIDDLNTAKTLTKLKTTTVSINPVLVIRDTELEKEYSEKNYKPLTVVQAVEVCKEMVKIFSEKNIEIMAIGFEPIDNDVEQKIFSEKVIAGPFHPAFRELVETNLWYDAIVNKIKKLNTKVMEVEVTVNPADTNKVIGYKQENIQKLKNTYDVDLIVTSNSDIKPGKSKIEVTKIFEN